MANWGNTFVSIHTADDLVYVKHETDNGRDVYYLLPKSAEGEQVLDALGSGSFTMPLEDRDVYPLIQSGRIARVYATSDLAPSPGKLEIATFIIDNITVTEPDEGEPELVVSGPDLMEELKRRLVKQPVIAEKTIGTVVLTTADYIQLATSASANDDEYNGAVVTFDSGGSGVIADYTGSTRRATIEDGTWSGPVASAGDDYIVYWGKAADDLDQAISHAPTGWSVSQSGTTDGTTLTIAGEKVYDALREIAIQSGEHFRLADLYPPTRELDWITGDDLGPVTWLLQVTSANVGSFYTDNTRAPIISIERTANNTGAMTRAYVTGGTGNNAITLRGLTGSDVTVPSGWTVDFDQSLIINSPAESGLHESQRIEEQLNISHVTPESDSTEARTLAKIELFNSAISTMSGADPRVKEYTVTAVLQQELRPGHKTYLTYTRTSGSETLWTVDGWVYVHRVKHSVGEDNIRYTELMVRSSLDPVKKATGSSVIASHENALNRGAGWAGDPDYTVGGVVIPGTPSTDHGGLTGLGDDDHTQYFRADGNRTLTGNLLINSGLTVDGVDLSVHAADSEAHHDMVSGGDGILVTVQEVSVQRPTDSGLTIDGNDKLLLGTPGTIAASGSGGVSGDTHNHPILAYDNSMTNPDQVLKSGATGLVQLRGLGVGTAPDPSGYQLDLDGDLKFIGSSSIVTDSGSLGLKPDGDLVILPGSELVEIGSVSNDTLIATHDFVSGLLGVGWGIDGAGTLDCRILHADELIVDLFTAEQHRVKNGSEWIAQSVTELMADITVPTVGNGATMYVKDAPGLEDMAIFANSDHLMMRNFDTSGGGLVVTFVWGQAWNYNPDGLGDGSQTWSFYTTSSIVTGQTMAAGTTVINFGQPGDGWISLTASDRMGSPYIDFGRWSGAGPYDTRSHPIRLGDLGGVTGERGVMGLFVGDKDGQHFIASENRLEAHGMRFSLYRDGGVSAGSIRVTAVEVRVYYDGPSTYDELRPSSDLSGNDFEGNPYTDNIVKTFGSTAYELIDEDPVTPTTSDYIRNNSGENAVATFHLSDITTSFIATNHVYINADVRITDSDTNMRLLGQIWAWDGTESAYVPASRPMLLATQDTADGYVSIPTATTWELNEYQWNWAMLQLSWYCAPQGLTSEVIRLDPAVPSLAVGSTIPTGVTTGGDGFWTGYETGYYKMRVGGTPTSSKPAMVWSGSDLYIANSDGDPVMRFYGSGLAWIEDTIAIESGGKLVTGNTQLDDAGLQIGAFAYGSSPGTDERLRFMNGTTEVASVQAFSGSGYSGMKWAIDASNYFVMGSSYGAYLYSDQHIVLTPGVSRYVRLANGVSIDGGLAISSIYESPPNAGELVLNQGGEDGSIIQMMSSDVIHGYTSSGKFTTNTYGSLQKYTANDGGLAVRGLTKDVVGLSIIAHTTSQDSTEASTSGGAIMAIAYDGLSTSLGADNNAFVVKSGTSTRFIVKGNGDFYYGGADQGSFDNYDDISLVRLVERELSQGGIIDTVYDQFLQHNRAELLASGVMTNSGFISGRRMAKLQNGALWQLHQRLSQLEEQQFVSWSSVKQFIVSKIKSFMGSGGA